MLGRSLAILHPEGITVLAFIRTSEWPAHNVVIEEKRADGTFAPLEHTGAGDMSRDLCIKGIQAKKGGASLHQVTKLKLRPNTCAVLETKEHITTGPQVMGFICSRASLAAQGLIVSNLKVDPNYRDTLYITVFNAGTGTIPLERDQPFCAVVFCRTQEPSLVQTSRPDPEGIPRGPVDVLVSLYPYVLTGIFALLANVVATLVMK